MRLRPLLCGIFLFFALQARLYAQDISLPRTNLQTKKLAVIGDTLRLDSLSVAPGTLVVNGMADSNYLVFPLQSYLIWKHRPTDSVSITYRALPVAFGQYIFHKDTRLVDSVYSFYDYRMLPGNEDSGFVNFNQLDYNGSVGRSVSLGNNQDVVLNSSFNLQANGYILDSVKLEAALSDNTVPFQPEGNTQRLQEFDQIFIHLQKKYQQLQLGDYNLEKPKGYFLNYFKRVQGILYQNRFDVGAQGWNAYGVSGSVSKGQFARNIFQGSEGNQGPYKLTGNNGEQFFIVLAASERVFINGVLMERGEQQDYIINYNTGEIRFMPRRLITKDSRIQVEFEYQDRNYLNSLIYAYDELQIGKRLNLRFNAYSNQDAKNQSYQQTFSGDQKRFLAGIGDSIQYALYPVINLDTFAADKILYKIVDSTVAGVFYDSVFVYSINPDSARYSLSFSFVGQNHGDYNISSGNANGRVYDWIPRISGVPQGSYAPVALLITPKMQQVFTLAADYQIDSFKRLNVETAVSNYDPNLFSTKDNNTHVGEAVRIHYNEARMYGKKDSLQRPHLTWMNDASYEFVSSRFRAVAPYRNVEFGRDWNVPQQGGQPTEHLASYSTKIESLRLGAAGYAFTFYNRGNGYNGYRNIVSYLYNRNRWNNGFVFNLLQSKDTFQQSQFFRPVVFAEYQLKSLLHTSIGVRAELENDELRNVANDTLLPSSFRDDRLIAYLHTPDDQPVRYSLNFTRRRDFRKNGNELAQFDHSNTLDVGLGLTQWKNHNITITGSYRKLFIDDTTIAIGLKPEESLLARLEYSGSALSRVFTWQSLYEIGSGQEQRRSYTFLEVPAGQGLYDWVDYNGDGVQQSNEFELAIYPDQKKYIKVLTLTNEYVRVNYVTYNQTVYIDPSAYFPAGPKTKWQKFIVRFSNQTSLQISNRLLSEEGTKAYDPFTNTLSDDNIIFTGNTLSNTFYFNRSSTVFGLDYNYYHTGNKQLLTYGVEGSGRNDHLLKFRYSPAPAWTFNLSAKNSLQAYNSALEDGRTYRIHGNGIEPAVTWLYRSMLRVTTNVRYEQRENESQFGGQQATFKTAGIEFRYTQPTAGAIELRGTYTGIAFDGVKGTPLSFTMLDALQPGDNFLWFANWQRRVGKGIEMSLEYEGRKPAGGTVIHTGRMSIRAIL